MEIISNESLTQEKIFSNIETEMGENNTVLIPYDSFIVNDRKKFIFYNQHFAKKTADLFQDIICLSNKSNTFKPLILIG